MPLRLQAGSAAMASATSCPSVDLSEKVKEIEKVLLEPEVDLWKLRELALTEGGLVNDSIRKKAWPKLVGLYDLYSNDGEDSSGGDTSGEAAQVRQQPNDGADDIFRLPNITKKGKKIHDFHDEDEDDDDSVVSSASTNSWKNKKRRRAVPVVAVSMDYDQIEKDVARCTWHLLTGSQRAQRLQMEHLNKKNRNKKRVARLIRRKQRKLANLINYTLVQSYSSSPKINESTSSCTVGIDKLRYFQGYHDIACICLSSLGGAPTATTSTSAGTSSSAMGTLGDTANMEVASSVLLRISQTHFRDCLRTNFAQLQTALRLSLFPLLAKFDPAVHSHLQYAEMEPYFCLSWVITWFSHDIRDTELVKRLFDAFVVSHPLLPLYLSVAMIIHPMNRREVLECECDFSLLHQTLAGLPKNSSMTGWKYQPGDGYVTDEEVDRTVSTGDSMDESTEFLLVERLNANDYGFMKSQETSSLVSSTLSCSLEPPAPVPFQELIEGAMEIMRKVPPRNLLNLASRYYGSEKVEEMLKNAPGISFFRPEPPEWATRSTAKADWVLKNRVRKKRLKSGTSTTLQRSRKRGREGTEESLPTTSMEADLDERNDRESVQRYLKENGKSMAVIACGFGPGDDAERRRRKRRKAMLAGTVAVAMVAVAVGVALQYSHTSSNMPHVQPSQPMSNNGAEELNRFSPLASPLEEVPTMERLSSLFDEATCAFAPAPPTSPKEEMSLTSGPSTSMSGPVESRRSTQPAEPISSTALAVWNSSSFLSTTWSADASYYGAILLAVERVSLREALRVHAYLLTTYTASIRPQLEYAVIKMNEFYIHVLETDFRTPMLLLANHAWVALDTLRRTDIEQELRMLASSVSRAMEVAKVSVSRAMEVAKESDVVKQLGQLMSASAHMLKPQLRLIADKLHISKARLSEQTLDILENMTENARGLQLTRKVESLVKAKWNSPVGQRFRRACQKVAANPVWHKVVETTVAAMLDATVTGQYGR